MAALDTVAQYVSLARTLLQDTKDSPYRYSDTDLVLGLNLALMEAKKLRPDLFITLTLPFFTANDSTLVVWDAMYRVPLVYYMSAHVQLRDDEEVQDQRAAAFLGLFKAQLTTT
jgi:hypothetical protein